MGEHASPAGPQATVLQMALVGCAEAHGGEVLNPYLVEGIYSASGERSYAAALSKFADPINSQVADQVLEVMRGVVTQGTATDAAISGVSIAGKTGTAEKEGREDDSWFIGIGDADGARNVVVAIMVEDAGRSVHAAGLSREVMRAALEVQGAL